jgi:hypothetical protein
MWEPRPLTPLWAFTACYRDSFTYFIYRWHVVADIKNYTKGGKKYKFITCEDYVNSLNNHFILIFASYERHFFKYVDYLESGPERVKQSLNKDSLYLA